MSEHTSTDSYSQARTTDQQQATREAAMARAKAAAERDGAKRSTIEQGITYLASRCDGAVAEDGQGFNGRDAEFGASLAAQIAQGRNLSARQREIATKMCRLYGHQLAQAGIVIDFAAVEQAQKIERKARDEAEATISLTVVANALHVRIPFSLKDEIKTLPGRRWNAIEKVWTLPASVAAAEGIARLAKAHRLQLVLDEGSEALVEQARSAYAARSLRSADDVDLPELPVDLGPGRAPWSHQRQAFAFGREQAATMLAMEMGTGKSLVTVGLLEGWDAKRVLIVCPKAAIGVWPREFRASRSEWTVVRSDKGSSARKAADMQLALQTQERVTVVVNYDSVWREDIAKVLLSVEWDAVVCDESHRIKSPGARSSKFMARLGAKARRRLCLTGTPLGQTPLDIYGQYRFLDPGIFGTSYNRFRARYAIMGGFEGREVVGMNPATAAELTRRIGSISYQCKAADVLDLPEALEVTRTCRLEPSAMRAYLDMQAEMVAETEAGTVTAANGGVRVLRMQQITSGHLPNEDPESGSQAVVVSTAKRELLKDVLADAPSDQPVVVFAKFTHDLKVVFEVAAELGREYRELSGKQRNLLNADAKMADGFTGIGGVQIQSGGAGIDLTAARLAVYYSVGHSLTDYEQSLKRLHRPGQHHPVLYTHLVADGTYDEVIYRALTERKNVIEAVLAAAKKAS